MEQELTPGLCERQITQLGENDEFHAGQMLGGRPCRLLQASVSSAIVPARRHAA